MLGPLEVRYGGRAIALGGGRQRSVLAQLLLEAGQVVSTDRLIDELWGESPPATAATALQGYVSQLRKALDPERGGGGETVIVTREPGYLIAIAPEQLDLARFEGLQADARRAMAGGDARAAANALEQALALWRGGALEDLAGERFASEAARRLEELRLTAIEERFDAELALGRSRELVPELEAVIAREPLREHLRAQLMLALYRSGRQAEALRAYDDARRTLVHELGIEPGSELRVLHQRILEQDSVLDVGSVATPARATPPRARGRRRIALLVALPVCSAPPRSRSCSRSAVATAPAR